MRVGLSEALDIFRAWMSARFIARVEGTFRSGFSFGIQARVVFVGDEGEDAEVRLVADDMASEFSVRLKGPAEIYYNDNRIVEGSAKEFREAVTLAFEPVAGKDAGDLDNITLGAFEPK